MNKKEIAEIRKQFSPENCAITRICGCYVDSEKNKKTSMKEAFLSLPEDEMFKYMDIFKKTLSGQTGKNLMSVEYTIAEEAANTPHNFLMDLRESKLADDDLTDKFYDAVIENYISSEPYYIILIHAMYDIPGKTSDNVKMFDSSDDVYEFIMCSICPVKLSKAALFYDTLTSKIENHAPNWIVNAPLTGFIFPAFNDRQTDIHGCLYYIKKSDVLQVEFVKNVLGCALEMSADDQNDAFKNVLADTVGSNGKIEDLLSVYREICERLEGSEWSGQECLLSKSDAEQLIVDDAWGGEVTEICFNESWDEHVGKDASLPVQNIAGGKKLAIECGNAEIKVEPWYSDGISEKIIDGQRCLVIPVNSHLTVNGIDLKGENGHE